MGKLLQEFKEFAFKGNVLDMAVGVVIGGAFTAIVTSVVNDLFTPLIAKLTGAVNFSDIKIPLGAAAEEGGEVSAIMLGNFIQAVINFFLIAICVFLFVKGINKLRKPKAAPAPAKAPRICPYCKSEIADDATRCPHCTSQLN